MHQFINDSNEDLKFTWTILPAGLEVFFKKIGKKCDADKKNNELFDRPINIDQIEQETGFG